MVKKHQVHNLIILDESGSMQSIKEFIIKGFNELVQTVKGIGKQYPEQEHYITMVTFNGLGNKILHFIDPVDKIDQINASTYRPDANTPLFDAIGFSISKLKQVLENTKDYNVLVTILTDGEENASKEYSGLAVKELIEELKQNRWTFTYIGTEHDVSKMVGSLSIPICNSMTFENNEEGIKDMFAAESIARCKIVGRIDLGEATSDNYYEDTNKADSEKP